MMKKQKGFSLVEIMIAVGLLGGLTLLLLNISKQSTKTSVKTQFDFDVTLTTNEINAILSDPVKCLSTFGTTATPDNIGGKFYLSSLPQGANGYGNTKVKIKNYSLGSDGVLTIRYQNKTILGAADLVKKTNLYIEGTPGAVTKCRSLATSTTDIWSKLTPTSLDTYYLGKVGIGTTNPQVSLDVEGGIKPGDQTQVTICDASTEGTQRYNMSTHTMEYCGASGSPLVYSWMGSGGASAQAVCATIEGYTWDTATNKCKQNTKQNNYSFLVAFSIRFNGSSWSLSDSHVLYTSDPNDKDTAVVLESTEAPSGHHYKFRMHYAGFYINSTQILTASLITSDSRMKLSTPDTDGNNKVEIMKSDDASGNNFINGDIVRFIAIY